MKGCQRITATGTFRTTARTVSVALAALALVVAVSCKAEHPAPAGARAKNEQTLTMAALVAVFGGAEDAKSGLSDFTRSDKEIFLSYHLYLTDSAGADNEIARDLAPKIRRLYGHFADVDRACFEISLPNPGSAYEWKPYVSFTLTRKIVRTVGWSDLLDTDLLSAALDVKRAG
jgi:hypothetical protein